MSKALYGYYSPQEAALLQRIQVLETRVRTLEAQLLAKQEEAKNVENTEFMEGESANIDQ